MVLGGWIEDDSLVRYDIQGHSTEKHRTSQSMRLEKDSTHEKPFDSRRGDIGVACLFDKFWKFPFHRNSSQVLPMTINEYLQQSEFSKQKELRRVLLLAYFSVRKLDESSFTIIGISDFLVKLGYPRPNGSRLKTSLKKSRMFVAAGTPDAFKLHPSALEALDTEFPNLQMKTEEVISHDSVIQESLLQKDRAFLKSLIKQINSSYENNIFDGCAVLMRRLLEILLIFTYQECRQESNIQDAFGQYKQLNEIIDDAIVNKVLGLSRNTKESLHLFRKLGNFSAHKIYYNANRKSIESVILDYKAAIEELLYKSNLRS